MVKPEASTKSLVGMLKCAEWWKVYGKTYSVFVEFYSYENGQWNQLSRLNERGIQGRSQIAAEPFCSTHGYQIPLLSHELPLQAPFTLILHTKL